RRCRTRAPWDPGARRSRRASDRGSRTRALAAFELYEPRLEGAVGLHAKLAHRDGQSEAPRPGAARIDEEHALAPARRRLVRMARDHRLHAGRDGIEVELREVVDHVEPARGHL